jgi:hypothetical protein
MIFLANGGAWNFMGVGEPWCFHCKSPQKFEHSPASETIGILGAQWELTFDLHKQ